MARFRSIVTALVTCALAALPAANASAAVHMAGTMGKSGALGMASAMAVPGSTSSARPADCETHAHMAPHHQEPGATSAIKSQAPCSDGTCGGKCMCLGLAVSGVLVVSPAMPSLALAGVPTARLAANLRAPSVLPPSPPPRV